MKTIPSHINNGAGAHRALVRVALARRSWTLQDLAAASGASLAIVSESTSRDRPLSQKAKHQIETAFAEPIWSTPEEFAARQIFIQRLGFDPFVLPLLTVKKLARKAKISIPHTVTSRAAVFALIQSKMTSTQPKL